MTCSFLVFCVPIIPGIWNGSYTRDPTVMRMWCNRPIFWTHPLHRFPRTRINGALNKCRGYWKISKILSFSRDSKYEENTDLEWPLDQFQGIVRTREIISTVEDASSSNIETDGRSGSCPRTKSADVHVIWLFFLFAWFFEVTKTSFILEPCSLDTSLSRIRCL